MDIDMSIGRSAPSRGWVLSLLLASALASRASVPPVAAAPPYQGTAFLHPAIIVESDPTALVSVKYTGRFVRWIFDRREGSGDNSYGSGAWAQRNIWLFSAKYDDGPVVEIRLHPEFTRAAAAREASHYARIVGQLPVALRTSLVDAGSQPYAGVSINKGDFDWGGGGGPGGGSITIHVDRSPQYVALGAVEEVLLHEIVHASLDPVHGYRRSQGWLDAQAADGEFISTYARDYPESEDLAESFSAFFAAEYRADRLPASMLTTIRETIPNRTAYFESLGLDMRPGAKPGSEPPETEPDPDPPEPEPEPPCPDDALCFNEGRFEVRTNWTVGDESGAARPRALDGVDGGLFSFFGPENPELLVKVLDGCGVNGHYWVYVAAATDVAFEVTVEERGGGGARKVYRHTGGELARALGDVSAFPCSSS